MRRTLAPHLPSALWPWLAIFLAVGGVAACSPPGEQASALPTGAESVARQLARGCDGGDAYACHNLAVSWRDGADGLSADASRALELFSSACDAGATTACRHAARMLVDREEPAPARIRLRQACDARDAFACTDLAFLIDDGVGAPPDPITAFAMLEEACTFRVPHACIRLARHLLDEAHPLHDSPRGRTLLATTCHGGLAEACAEGGLLVVRDLRAGRVDPDPDPPAPHEGGLPHILTLDPATAAPASAEELLRQGCLGGISRACSALATLLREGDLLPRDENRAERLERMAAEARF